MITCRLCRFFSQEPRRRKAGRLQTCEERGRKPSSKVCKKFTTDIKCIFCKKFKSCKKTKSALQPICKDFVSKFTCGDCVFTCKDRKGRICNKFVFFKPQSSGRYKEGIRNIINYVFEIENELNRTLLNLQDEFVRNGTVTRFDDRRLREYTDKLLSVAILNFLIQLYGLEKYRDSIISNEINRLWPIGTPPIREIKR